MPDKRAYRSDYYKKIELTVHFIEYKALFTLIWHPPSFLTIGGVFIIERPFLMIEGLYL